MLDDAQASFGLGLQVHEVGQWDDGSVLRSVGHAGVGGSIVLCISEIGLSLAFTTNQLNFGNSLAKEQLLRAIFEEYDLVAPKSLLG